MYSTEMKMWDHFLSLSRHVFLNSTVSPAKQMVSQSKVFGAPQGRPGEAATEVTGEKTEKILSGD